MLSDGGGTVNVADADADATNEIQTITNTFTTIYQEQYAGGARGLLGTSIWTRNATITQLSEGLFEVEFAIPHPDSTAYHISYEGIESETDRDNPKITTVDGSKSATGFQVMITVDDNGIAADVYEDNPWSFSVDAPIDVITNLSLIHI